MKLADSPSRAIRDYYGEEYYEGERNLSERRWMSAKYLLSLDAGSTVLDLGAGTGENAAHLRDSGLIVTCVDFGLYGILVCRKKGLDGVVADARFLPFKEDAFDGLCSTSFLEHVAKEDVSDVLYEAQRVVKEEGKLVVHTEPNKMLERLSILYGLVNRKHWRRYHESGGHINTYTPWRFLDDLLRSNLHVSAFLMDGYPREAPFAKIVAPLSRWRYFIRLLGNEMWAVARNFRRPRPLPFVSVIVPVKNEKYNIVQCLAALARLDYGPYEIIVVDGGSDDGTQELVKGTLNENPRIEMVIHDGNPASSRNIALPQAKGEVFAFTDADCVADPKWLESVVKALIGGGPDVAGVGGPNISVATDPNYWSDVIPASLNTFLGGANSAQVSTLRDGFVRALSAANSAYWASAIREVGGFDSRLDFCEDSDLSAKLIRRGFKLRFASNAKVYHLRNYHSPLEFGRHMFQYGRGRGEALVVKPSTTASLTSLTIIVMAATFLSLLFFALLGSAISGILLISSLAAYTGTTAIYALALSRGRFRAFGAAILSYLILHTAYAAGLFTGIFLTLPRLIAGRARC